MRMMSPLLLLLFLLIWVYYNNINVDDGDERADQINWNAYVAREWETDGNVDNNYVEALVEELMGYQQQQQQHEEQQQYDIVN